VLNFKKNIKTAGGCAAVFAAVTVMLWLLLLLSALIPNEAIKGNMVKSIYGYAECGAFEMTRDGSLNSVADNYADAILLNIAWNMGNGSPFTSVIDTKYHDGDGYGVNTGLFHTVIEGTEPNTEYTRYWHGSAAAVRLLSLACDVSGIKLIGFAAVLSAAAVSLAMLAKRGHYDIAVLLAVSAAAVRIWDVRLSMEYQAVFLLTFLLLPAYLVFERKSNTALIYISVIGGTATAFFDFLTAETLTVLLPLAVVTAVRAKEERLGRLRGELPTYIGCCGGWGISYAAAFFVKWFAAWAVTGENAVLLALGHAAERVGGAVEFFDEKPGSVFSAPLANLNMLFGGSFREQPMLAIICTAAAAAVLFGIWYLFRNRGERSGSLLLLMLGGTVLVRFLVLNNHSFLHCFFTYRALAVTVFAVLAALMLNIRRLTPAPQRKKKGGKR